MPDLGNAVLRLIVSGKGFKQGLATAEQQTTKFAAKGEKQVGRVRGAFGKLGKEVDNALGKIPIIGSSLAALPGPAKAVAAGIALVGFALAKMVGRIVDLEKALRPMVERSGLASDSLQLLAKAAEVAGSEDGLEGVTDSAQELQLRLAEVVQDGTGPAKEAFEKLGISAQDLIDKSPEDMLLAVVAALQNVTNEADRKFLADELLGGSSEKLAGLLNLTNEELGNQLQHLADTGDFMSGEALADAKAYSGSVDELKNSFGSMATQIGSVLIPILTGLVEALNSMGKGLDWVAKVMGWAKDDTNEFTEAADEMAKTLGDGTAPAIEVTREAAEEAAQAVEKMGNEVATATGKVAELTSTSRTGAEVIEDLRVASLDAKSAIELMRLEVQTSDGSMKSANTTALTYLDTMTSVERVLEAWRITQLEARQEADLFALSLGTVRTGYTNVAAAAGTAAAAINEATSAQQRFAAQQARDLANSVAGNAALVNDVGGGGRTSGRSAGRSRGIGDGRIVHVVGELGQYKYQFRTEHGQRYYDTEDHGRKAAAEAWLRANPSGTDSPAAQRGAAVRGSRYGSLVRVGENFTDENITPVGRNGSGSGGGSGAPMVIPVNLGGETLATIYVEGKRVAVREGRD